MERLSGTPASVQADEFVELACLTFQSDDSPARRRRAERLLKSSPRLADESFPAAVVLGDVAAVERALAVDPQVAARPTGPRNWAPLLYLCFGRVLGPVGGCDAVAVARRLLAAGADPRSAALFHGQYRFTAVTAAIGEGESGPINAPPHPQARALVELLLDAGADPNDSQALYDTHFRRDNRWLAMFLARGLGPADPANWTADDPTLILEYLLGQAAKQGFIDRVALLLAHGTSANGRDHYKKRTHLENALLAGHREVADLLVRAGADPPSLTAAEGLRVDCLRADETTVRRQWDLVAPDRDDTGTLLTAAEHGRLKAVRLLLDLGVPVDGTNREGVTALHLAAAGGHRLVVDELLTRGARTDIRDHVYGGTALGRATWTSRIWPTPECDEICRFLVARSTDVFNVAYVGAADRLAVLLAEDPTRARAQRASDGRSALHVLAGQGVPDCIPCIQLLLDHHADLEALDGDGKTALALALETDADEVATYLEQRGARRPS